MKVSLFQATPNPVEFIATIASICYGNEDVKDPYTLVKRLYKNGHHSVFEHVYFTFKIEGISRACSHQLVRHRLCSFTQRSQRYCNEANSIHVVPESMKNKEFVKIQLNEVEKDCYNLLLESGVPKEDARYILSNACATDLYLSCNLRELIHIANERLCKRSQWEIRDLVTQMIELVDDDLKFMLVPKCKSGRIICHEQCPKKEGN